jgi:hypothetical protein
VLRLIIEYSNASTKPIRNAAPGSDFFVLKPYQCCTRMRWQGMSKCCTSQDWKALRVTTPLVSGDDLEWGIAKICAFDKVLRTTGKDSFDKDLLTTGEPFWGPPGYGLDVLARCQNGMTLDRYKKVASLWMLLRESMFQLFAGSS